MVPLKLCGLYPAAMESSLSSGKALVRGDSANVDMVASDHLIRNLHKYGQNVMASMASDQQIMQRQTRV